MGEHPQGRRPSPGSGADSGISKSEVSRICADLDAEVAAFRDRSLAGQAFPNPEALLRLAGAVLVEAHDEWQVSDRRYLSESSMALLTKATREVAPAQLMPA
jgi:transposase-like protein